MLMPFANVMWYRHYDDKVAEVQQGIRNCPCVPVCERWVLASLKRSNGPLVASF
jgi:hypothetical protein